MRWFWIDRFVEFVPKAKARAIKNVSLAEGHLHDHFPGWPVLPPSLVLEGMAQTGGLLVAEALGFSRKVVLAKVPRFEQFALARPGDQIEYEATVQDLRTEGAAVTVVARVAGATIAEAEVFFAALEAPEAASEAGREFLRDWTTMLGLEAARVAAPLDNVT